MLDELKIKKKFIKRQIIILESNLNTVKNSEYKIQSSLIECENHRKKVPDGISINQLKAFQKGIIQPESQQLIANIKKRIKRFQESLSETEQSILKTELQIQKIDIVKYTTKLESLLLSDEPITSPPNQKKVAKSKSNATPKAKTTADISKTNNLTVQKILLKKVNSNLTTQKSPEPVEDDLADTGEGEFTPVIYSKKKKSHNRSMPVKKVESKQKPLKASPKRLPQLTAPVSVIQPTHTISEKKPIEADSKSIWGDLPLSFLFLFEHKTITMPNICSQNNTLEESKINPEKTPDKSLNFS
jgi:hypothetical protein